MGDFDFGSEHINAIQLCKMQKDVDGHYITISSLPL